MPITTTVVTFPAPTPSSGSTYSEYYYTYAHTQSGDGGYSYTYSVIAHKGGFSQQTFSGNLNSLGIPNGAQIISVVPKATVKTGCRILLNGTYFMSPSNMTQIKEYIAGLDSYNTTLFVTYSANPKEADLRISLHLDKPVETTTVKYELDYSFTPCSLSITWIPEGENPEDYTSDDPLHPNADPSVLFVVNPYGPAKEASGVGVGGWPTGEANDEPTYDSYMKTVFKKPMIIEDTAYIYQTPVWRNIFSDTSGLQNNYLTREENGEIYGMPEFCRMNGTVYIRGFVTRANAVPIGGVIFTLPEGYRPSSQITRLCVFKQSNAGSFTYGTAIEVTIDTNGDIKAAKYIQYSRETATPSTAASWINLDMSFRLG